MIHEIHAIKANLIEELYGSEPLTGIVHSRFRSVINIQLAVNRGPKRLITLMTHGHFMVPDSIIVSEQDFKVLSVLDIGTHVMMHNGRLRFSGNEVFEVCVVVKCQRLSSYIDLQGFPHSRERHNIIPRVPGRLPLLYERLSDFLTFSSNRQASDTIISNKRKQLEALAGALISCDICEAAQAVKECVGYGRGLTPSADDAMVGSMVLIEGAWQAGYLPSKIEGYKEPAGYASNPKLAVSESEGCPNPAGYESNYGHEDCESNTGHEDSESNYGHEDCEDYRRTKGYEGYKRMMQGLLGASIIEGRTTDVSMKYLYCAMEGRFSEYLTALIRWTFTKDDKEVWSLLLDISGVGASSGTDMLAGMGIACRILLKALGIVVPYDREEDYS